MIERKTVTVIYILAYYEVVMKAFLAKLEVDHDNNDQSY